MEANIIENGWIVCRKMNCTKMKSPDGLSEFLDLLYHHLTAGRRIGLAAAKPEKQADSICAVHNWEEEH